MLNTLIFGEGIKNDIYINESFTRYTSALFLEAKKFKKENNFKYLWLKNSNILLKKSEFGKAFAVRSFDDFLKIEI